MILAAWYKRALKESLLGKIYANRSKLRGVDQDPKNNQVIYQRYLQAYKKGVFNFIKEDVDRYTNETIPRKYFSGGMLGAMNFPQIERKLGVAQGTAAMKALMDRGPDAVTWEAVETTKAMPTPNKGAGKFTSQAMLIEKIKQEFRISPAEFKLKILESLLIGLAALAGVSFVSIEGYRLTQAIRSDHMVTMLERTGVKADKLAIFEHQSIDDLAKRFRLPVDKLTSLNPGLGPSNVVSSGFLMVPGRIAMLDYTGPASTAQDLALKIFGDPEMTSRFIREKDKSVHYNIPVGTLSGNLFLTFSDNNHSYSWVLPGDSINSGSKMFVYLPDDQSELKFNAWKNNLQPGKVAVDTTLKNPETDLSKDRHNPKVSQAMKPGGIDFNASNLNFKIRRDGSGVPLPVSQQDMAQISSLEGIEPFILDIRPATSLPFYAPFQK